MEKGKRGFLDAIHPTLVELATLLAEKEALAEFKALSLMIDGLLHPDAISNVISNKNNHTF